MVDLIEAWKICKRKFKDLKEAIKKAFKEMLRGLTFEGLKFEEYY